jgi:D-alanyl-D-alanine carboxypeptidase/D-alanyl-D-alanine-endopeptidase (penicillin-binding protein 4)
MRAMLFARVSHWFAALGGRSTRARLTGSALRPLVRARAALWTSVLASCCATLGLGTFAHARPPANALPAAVDAALGRAGVPHAAVSVVLVDADAASPAAPRLSHRASEPMHPASVIKLVTTYAALDLLGPAYTWRTQVFVEGAVREGTLYGNVYLKGQGDPQLVHERLWLLLRRMQGIGIQTIAGDIVLDRSAFDVPATDPAAFDGEPLRPYNVGPDALLINYKAVLMTFTPDPTRDRALVQFDPPLFGVQTQTSVPLANGPCGDYTLALKADFSDPLGIRFAGNYPLACGEKTWPIAYADPASYGIRAVQGLWLAMGGTLGGVARYGVVPQALAASAPTLEVRSPTLAEVVRDTNKFSNNVMAQQIFLTLAGEEPSTDPHTSSGKRFDAARAAVLQWWKQRIMADALPVLDNGSGLSRHERMSALALARLLQVAYGSAYMPEFMASLPIAGVDGTLRRSPLPMLGSAHLKTGSLSTVLARAGYVDAASGKRYVLVAIINHANAQAARSAMDALLQWAINDQ